MMIKCSFLKNIPLMLIAFFTIYYISAADRCRDTMLLDGTETIIQYGMDSTRHWWALTTPFTTGARLIVDGKRSEIYNEIKSLVFSPDGNRWACFAMNNTQWMLLTNEGETPLPGSKPGEIIFSPNSEALIYSYFEGETEVIETGTRRVKIYGRTGSLFTSHGGERLAFMGYRGDRLVLNINGNETTPFDEIIPIGFWYDGNFMYAARNGSIWEIYKNNEAITEAYYKVMEPKINLAGTVLGALVKHSSGKFSSILISDEYWEPLIGKLYDEIGNLVLHPEIPILAYTARMGTSFHVVMSSTEYDAGTSATVSQFTHDGKDLYFPGCKLHCFININGRAYKVNDNLTGYYVMKPESRTIAYTTSSSLVVRYLEKDELVAGMMVDETSAPRFNWRTGRYEALGRINQKLYLLTCGT